MIFVLFLVKERCWVTCCVEAKARVRQFLKTKRLGPDSQSEYESIIDLMQDTTERENVERENRKKLRKMKEYLESA